MLKYVFFILVFIGKHGGSLYLGLQALESDPYMGEGILTHLTLLRCFCSAQTKSNMMATDSSHNLKLVPVSDIHVSNLFSTHHRRQIGLTLHKQFKIEFYI